MRPVPDTPTAGQESVWAYPRPPRAELTARHIRIEHRGVTVADTRRAVRTLETSHPPTYYIPREDIAAALIPAHGPRSICEWKGQASYWDVTAGGETLSAAAWSYARPTPAFCALAGFLAFYAARFDCCLVDGEPVTPQPGGFYGGWITRDLAGPFKGVPGSGWW